MLIYEDLFSGDEILSDSFTPAELYEGTIVKVITKKMVEFDDRYYEPEKLPEEVQDALNSGDADLVNQIPHQFKYNVLALAKKDFIERFKKYAAALKAKIPADQQKRFQDNANKFAMDVVKNFSEYEIFVGENNSDDGMLILLKWEEADCCLFFWKDGLKEIKC